jgi:hypothetical protein
MKNNLLTAAVLFNLTFFLEGCGHTIMLTSAPSGASIYYAEDTSDSLKLFDRSTPTNIYWDPQKYSDTLYIQVKKQGYRNSNVVAISAGKIPPGYYFILDSSHSFVPAQTTKPQSFGYVKFSASEANVNVYIDNEPVGQITKDLPFVKKLPPGNYLITARKEFFGPVSFKLNLYENDVFPYHFDLQRVGRLSQFPDSASRKP